MANELLKVAVIGEAEGQEIVSILYYSPSDLLSGWPMAVVAREEFHAQFMPALKTVMDPLLSADYVGLEVQYSAVTQSNTDAGGFMSSMPNTIVGEVAGGSDTVALAAIVGFQCLAWAVGPGIRVPKKSYVALGPIASANIGDNGLLLWNAAEKLTVTNFMKANVTVEGGESGPLVWSPVRVGVPNKDNIPAVGYVAGAIVRQYTRPRKSRLFRANGR